MVKDQEYLTNIANKTIELSKQLGATDTSVHVAHSISETVNLRNKKLDESNRSDSFAISITTYIGKKNQLSLHLIYLMIMLKHLLKDVLVQQKLLQMTN